MVDIKEAIRPSECVVTLIESLQVVAEQCGEETIDILCDIVGVDDEARQKIKAGECPELTRNGCTECICNSQRAIKAYVVCRALDRIKEGETIYEAIVNAQEEVRLQCTGLRED